MSLSDSPYKMDRNALSTASLYDESDEKEYWFTKSGLERLEALEYMRQVIYGYDPFSTRFQRILTVVELERG